MNHDHGFDDLLRLWSEHVIRDSGGNEGDGLDDLSSELPVLWLWVLIQAGQQKLESLVEVWVELFLDGNGR